jgi:hypothetical protein
VFTLLQQQEVPSPCLPRNLPCFVFESSWHQQWVYDRLILDCGKLVSSTLFFIITLLHILDFRLSFCIVHSIIIYSTISKLTVSPREIGRGGTRGTGVTSNHGDNETHRSSDSVFYNLIWALQNEWLFLHASARTLLNFHGLQGTISYQISWRILPQSPS